MKHSAYLAGLMLTTLAVCSTSSYAASLCDAHVNQAGMAAGHISAWGDNLSDMSAQLADKANRASATCYVITSARAGNRTYGTAIIYR